MLNCSSSRESGRSPGPYKSKTYQTNLSPVYSLILISKECITQCVWLIYFTETQFCDGSPPLAGDSHSPGGVSQIWAI